MTRHRNVASDHPLELLPYFRRWQPGLTRDLVYTGVLGTGFGLLFFGLYAYDLPRQRLLPQLVNDFVIAIAIAYAIHALFAAGQVLLGPWLRKCPGWLRTAYYLAVPTAGVFAGYFIGLILLNPAAARHTIFTPGIVVSFAMVSVLVSCVLLFLSLMRAREMRGQELLAAEQHRVLEADHRALQAQLRMLQAQIEPHFLYNTLANAVGLIDPAPARARLLLERLIDYLRMTLAASRDTDAPLQRQVDAITAYLELMKLRMGERLRYRIAVTDEAAGISLPPMLLQPVIENAISHGLEPNIAGGEIVLTAAIEQHQLCIVISDTGVGLRANGAGKVGGGVGLSNLRERIVALYGKDGSLNITTNAAGGVSVSLRIPHIESTCTPH